MLLTCVSTVRGEIDQRRRDLPIGEAVGKHPQHVGLTRAESLEGAAAADAALPRRIDEVAHDPRGVATRHRQLTLLRPSQRTQQSLWIEILGEVAGRAAGEGLDHVTLRIRHREHHDLGVRKARRQFLEHLQSIHARQVDVEQHHVRSNCQRQGEGILRGGCLTHHLHVRGIDRLAHRGAHQCVVVHEHHAQGASRRGSQRGNGGDVRVSDGHPD